MTDFVEIFEVGPRDGLQNEKRLIPAAEKIALINALGDAGFRRIEATSFVSPKWVPQMGDAAEVMAGVTRRDDVGLWVLTPNMRGLEGAVAAGADGVAVFAAATEGFSRANLNCSIAESMDRFAPILEAATMPVRGYISCVTDCPYDGTVDPKAVAWLASELYQAGCVEISLGDTIGFGTPKTIRAMLEAVIDAVPVEKLVGHYHDTNGRALDNIEMSLGMGVRMFDAAVGGLGGCPYAPGAKGNVATEAVMERVEALGFDTGLDPAKVRAAAMMAKGMRA